MPFALNMQAVAMHWAIIEGKLSAAGQQLMGSNDVTRTQHATIGGRHRVADSIATVLAGVSVEQHLQKVAQQKHSRAALSWLRARAAEESKRVRRPCISNGSILPSHSAI